MKCADHRKTFICIGWNNSFSVLPKVNHTYANVFPEPWKSGRRTFFRTSGLTFYFAGIWDFGISTAGFWY